MTWAINLQAEVARRLTAQAMLAGGATGGAEGVDSGAQAGVLGPLALLDIAHLLVVPAVTALRLADSLDGRVGGRLLDLPPSLGTGLAFVGGALQARP